MHEIPTFAEADFSDTPYDTAHDKVQFLKRMCRWIAGGFVEETWARQRNMYGHLNLHLFGHIAHFGAHGFYHTWFSTPQQRAEWIVYARRGGAYGFHDLGRTDLWGDVERALVNWINASGIGDEIIAAASEDTEMRERLRLVELKHKYEPEDA